MASAHETFAPGGGGGVGIVDLDREGLRGWATPGHGEGDRDTEDGGVGVHGAGGAVAALAAAVPAEIDGLKPYHWAWLLRNTHRSPKWLKERLRDGFDIHHMDGNHDNDGPENLVLLDTGDHGLLHGGDLRGRLASAVEEAKRPRLEVGKRAYELRWWGFGQWHDIGRVLGMTAPRALSDAKNYALRYNFAWPIPHGGGIWSETPASTYFRRREIPGWEDDGGLCEAGAAGERVAG